MSKVANEFLLVKLPEGWYPQKKPSLNGSRPHEAHCQSGGLEVSAKYKNYLCWSQCSTPPNPHFKRKKTTPVKTTTKPNNTKHMITHLIWETFLPIPLPPLIKPIHPQNKKRMAKRAHTEIEPVTDKEQEWERVLAEPEMDQPNKRMRFNSVLASQNALQ